MALLNTSNSRFVEMFGYDYQDIPDGRTWRLKAFPDEDYRQEVLNAWIEDLKKAQPGAITRKSIARLGVKTARTR